MPTRLPPNPATGSASESGRRDSAPSRAGPVRGAPYGGPGPGPAALLVTPGVGPPRSPDGDGGRRACLGQGRAGGGPVPP